MGRNTAGLQILQHLLGLRLLARAEQIRIHICQCQWGLHRLPALTSDQIQKVTIDNKDTYHRVRAGPYRGKESTNQARALLTRNGLESIAIKLK